MTAYYKEGEVWGLGGGLMLLLDSDSTFLSRLPGKQRLLGLSLQQGGWNSERTATDRLHG